MEETPAPSRKYQFTLHKKGTPLSGAAKTIVMNVLCKCREQYPKESDNDCTKRTSFLTGVSKTSIIRMINEYKTTGVLSTPTKKHTTGKKATRLERYDEATLNGIRQIVDVYRERNQYYSVKQVMNDINEDPTLPTISKKTTERLLKDLGIVCAKKSTKSVNLRAVKKRKEAAAAAFRRQQANQTASAQANQTASARANLSASARANQTASARANQTPSARANQTASARANQTTSARANQTPSTQANQTQPAQANQTSSTQANQSPSSFLPDGPCRSLPTSTTLPIAAGYQPSGLYPPLPGTRFPADCRPMPDYAARWNYSHYNPSHSQIARNQLGFLGNFTKEK